MRVMRRLVCVIALLAMAACGVGAAQARLVHDGALTESDQFAGPFTSIASDGDTVAASYPGAVEVYTKPATGWANATPTANLVGPAGVSGPFAVAISGGTVVASYESNAPWFDDVFVEPPGGWSGSVSPAATLVAPNGWNLSSAVISGDTIVAGATDPHGTDAEGYFVYVRPAGGWSGTLLPAASLRDSSGLELPGPAAILGDTIFTGAERVVGPDYLVTVDRGDAFTEPAGGWSGTVQQSATLVGPRGSSFGVTSTSGRVVASYQSLFTEPRAGWHGRSTRARSFFPAPR
jgi:hypothetical protein